MIVVRFEIEKIIRKTFQVFGLDLKRISVNTSPSLQLWRSLEYFNIDTVLDIGANVGQFACDLRTAGYYGNIVSFEPLPDAHQMLVKASTADALWDVHELGAIGDFDGELNINISDNSVSSSILPMLKLHSDAEKSSFYVDKVKVPISRLDSIAKPYINNSQSYFIKIDTQGYEWKVLDGAKEVLSNAQGVLCELSLVPLYEGQHLWMEIIERMENEGFVLWSFVSGFTDPRDGKTLQVDAIFYRDSHVE